MHRLPRAATALALLALSAFFPAREAAAANTTARYAHVAAYMVDGRTIVAGGLDATNTPINTVELLDTQHGSVFVTPKQFSYATPMAVARASATITVLPNGNILVTGGWDGATARSDAEVYSPGGNSWVTVAGMSAGRFNHTATLLNTGSVLVCGGQTSLAAAVTNTCDLFTPAGAGGSFAATGNLLLGRALHTSTALRDGTVWIAGGWNPGLPNGGWVVTTERYNPASGVWQAAQPLNAARAYHTATLTGDNKILVVGGFNGRDVNDALGYPSKGILATSELFDPAGGSIVPGPPMNARVHKHTAVLEGNGDVAIYGGLGNIPATQLTASDVPSILSAGATVTGNFVNLQSSVTNHVNTGGSGTVPFKFLLGTPVTGQIIDGEVQFFNPQIDLNGATVRFTSADPLVPGTGVRGSLQGNTVGCDPVSKVCGQVNATLSLQNMNQGGYSVIVPANDNQLLPGANVTGSLVFSPSPLTPTTNGGSGNVTNGNFTTRVQLAVPNIMAGFSATNVTCTLSPNALANWAEQSSYTVTLNGGVATPAGSFPVITAGGVSYIDINPITFNNVKGILLITATGPSYTLNSPVSIPVSGAAALGNLSCSLTFGSTGLTMAGAVLKYSAYNVVIRNMVFGDHEWFTPNLNNWAFTPNKGSVTRPESPAEGAATVLTPQDDLLDIGGRACNGGCAAYVAASNGPNRQDTALVMSPNGFTAGTVLDPFTHAFHSANLLTDGTILLAGGTDGSYVLPTAEIYDPVLNAFTPTRSIMNTGRQKHSANLLPNGRVLFAGGFATTATSTGPTNTAEIYYPDTKVFLNTSVMVSSHSQHAAVTLPSGNVFVAGGYNNQTSVTGVAEVYYATAAAWVQVATMPGGQERAIAPAVQLFDGRVMMCGGTNSSGNMSSCVAYDPVANSWSALASMPTALQGHTMTLLFDGRVLVAGGDDGFGETTSSYIYDPSGNAWITGNPLQSARFGHAATVLPNGTVMISGGVQQVAPIPGSPANALKTVEFFHPFADFWADGGGGDVFSLGPRSFHTATLAPNGFVYFFGGANGSIGSSQSTAFYSKFERNYFTLFPDGDSIVQPSIRQSSITTITPASPFLPGGACPGANCFTVTGLRFRGATEASGGAAGPGNASFNYPHLMLQKIDGAGGAGAQSSPGFTANLTPNIPLNPANLSTLDTTLSVQLPATNAGLPYGWYMTWVGNNDVHSLAAPMVQVGPAKPAAAVTNLTPVTLGISSITYTWTGIGGVDGYNVYSATSGIFLATVPVSSPQYTQTNLLPNTTAGLIVAGYTLTGDGPATNSATAYTLAAVPTGVTIASVTFNTLLLQWNTSLNMPGTIYEVGESSDNFVTSFSTPVPNILGQTQNFVTITQLQPNTTYFFRVRAYNTAGLSSSWSTSVSTLTRTSVSGVTGVAVSPASIQWNWIPAGAVINYRVYNSTSGQLLATPASNSFTDTGLGINTQRSIQVSAVTPAGEGPLSPSATVYTQAAQPGFVPPPLTSLTTGSFTLQWSPNGNPNGTIYDVNIAAKVSSTTVISTLTTTGFFLSVGGLAPSNLYQIVIYATNGDGFLSAPLVVGSTYTLAAPPTNLKIDGTTPVSISADWSQNNNSTTTFYQVTYSTDNFVSNVSTAIPFSALYNGSTVTITGLLTSTTYWLRVAAENIYGQQTSFSNVVATITFNGGAPLGSLAGVVTANGMSEFSGNLVNGRFVDIRSPGGSFPVNTTVTISSYNAVGGLCPGGLNVAVSLTAAPALQPRVPIFFTASYTAGEIGAVPVSQLSLQRYEPTSGTCVPLRTTFDTVHQLFTAQLNHFSIYQLVQVPLATDTGTARIFPNPYRAATDAYITFDHIPPSSRVRVMTLRGETVLDAAADSTGLLTWNATNGAGRSVASGLYLVVFESGGSKKIGKLAVIR